MEYILSQKEMDAQKEKLDAKQKIINELCVMVADNMPIKFWNHTEAKVWGCPRSKEKGWYCDECPVQGYCSHDKRYSQ